MIAAGQAASWRVASRPPVPPAAYLSTLLPSETIENVPLGPATGSRFHLRMEVTDATAESSKSSVSHSTCTSQLAWKPPSWLVAVMVMGGSNCFVGLATITWPAPSSVAMVGSELVQATAVSVALEGVIVGTSVSPVPTLGGQDSEMPVTATMGTIVMVTV